MWRLKPIFAIISWWLAPVALKFFVGDIDLFISLTLILFFAWIPSLFKKKRKNTYNKSFIINTIAISILTIMHYLWNFYWIILWNIIITTVIIKSSPLFQTIIYSIVNKKIIPKYVYWMSLLLIVWVFLMCYNPSQNININFLFIFIPLISSLAWSFIMIYLSKLNNENEVLSHSNLLSFIIIFIISVVIWRFNIDSMITISVKQYFIYFLLWVIPTFFAPILWSKWIKTIWSSVIFLDYLTPIITIVFSLLLFLNNLTIYNYWWIAIIIVSLFLRYILQRFVKTSVNIVKSNIQNMILINFENIDISIQNY